jgi:outer membrane receptor protein involved in Fe transport
MNKNLSLRRLLLLGTSLPFVAAPVFSQVTEAPGATPTAQATSTLTEIVVTAQKREQRIDDVGATIQAATGQQLLDEGVRDPKDLSKIVPGFTYTQSPYSTPVYTLRGIGTYAYNYAVSPAVAIYQDQVPLPYPTMAVATGLDVQRVEVLKGPQGTLFGQSATGGAINYIANKPTDHFEAGADLDYDGFGKSDLEGFVSGPLASTLNARFAVRAIEGGAWQTSVSRPDDHLGNQNNLMGRLTLDWQPISELKISFTTTDDWDRSDNQAAQKVLDYLNVYGTQAQASAGKNPYAVVNPTLYNQFTNPTSPGYQANFTKSQSTLVRRYLAGEAHAAAMLGAPSPGTNESQAEWSPTFRPTRDDKLFNEAIRADYKLSDEAKITSITSYDLQSIHSLVANSGTVADVSNLEINADVHYVSEELRASLDTSRFHGIVGVSYDHTSESDVLLFNIYDSPNNTVLPGLRYPLVNQATEQTVDNYGVFAHGEYEVIDNLNIRAGVRGNESDRTGSVCASDTSAGQQLSKTFGNSTYVPGFGYYDLQTIFKVSPANHVVIQPGQCVTLNSTTFAPSLTPTPVELHEHNVPWELGINYKLDQGTLLYADVSKGYKAGIISGNAVATTAAIHPAKQESLLAYEAGLKAPAFGHRIQFNASGFFYNYKDKQLTTNLSDPIFGSLSELVNVPQSQVYGAEIQLIARPLADLTLTTSGTYLHSEVTGHFTQFDGLPVYNSAEFKGDFKGSPLPYTPQYSANFDVGYEHPVMEETNAFLGGNVSYASATNATFHTSTLLATDFGVPAYTMLDLRAGLSARSGAWRAGIYCRNCTNAFQVLTNYADGDLLYRYTGRPREIGATVSIRTR